MVTEAFWGNPIDCQIKQNYHFFKSFKNKIESEKAQIYFKCIKRPKKLDQDSKFVIF